MIKKSVAALPTQALRFVSLALSLKNICKSENPTSDSVDAQNYPVTWYPLPFGENPWEQGLKRTEFGGGGGSWATDATTSQCR